MILHGGILELMKMPYNNPDSITLLSGHLSKLLMVGAYSRQIIILCIGTDRSTGDSLGPLVGSKLAQVPLFDVTVIGTLEEPVHAMNLQKTMERIHEQFPKAFIVAIDACLGQFKNVGYIEIGIGPLIPGAGVHKDLPAIGDIHMKGIVNFSGFMEYVVLQNTRLSLVMNMAHAMANIIGHAVAETLIPLHGQKDIGLSEPFVQ